MSATQEFEAAIREQLAIIDASRPSTRSRSDQIAAAIREDMGVAGITVNRDTAGAFFHAFGVSFFRLIDNHADVDLQQDAHAFLLGAAALIREIDRKGGAS